jgi:hypothetical protein
MTIKSSEWILFEKDSCGPILDNNLYMTQLTFEPAEGTVVMRIDDGENVHRIPIPHSSLQDFLYACNKVKA